MASCYHLWVRLFARAFPLILVCSTALAAKPKKSHSHAKPAAPAEPGRPAEVLFTFDDGPHLQNTPKVLSLLAEHKVKAIFFVNGWHFEKDAREQALLREEVARGHYVGNHTYKHRILCKHLDIAPREIDYNEDLIESTLGYRPTLLRTPYGQHCPGLVRLADARGYDRIGWDIDAQEWRPGSKGDAVAKYIIDHIAHAHGRTIVLLHDVQPVTLVALPKILDWLEKHPDIKVLEPKVLLKPGAPLPRAQAKATLGP